MALCTVKVRMPVEMEDYFHIAVGHEVYSFGGAGQDWPAQSYLNVHVFNTVSLKWTQVFPRYDTYGKDNREVPRMRSSYSGVLIDNVIYILGGMDYLFRSDNVLYAFDVDTHTWINTKVSGTVPAARSHHSACVLGKVMYIHGGCVAEADTNDVYKLDTSTMVWSLIDTGGTAPPVSFAHSATIIGTKMFVFGGLWWKANYRDIRVFDTETNLWLSTPSAQLLPLGRYSPSAFAYNGELYICGTDTGEDLKRLGPGANGNGFPWKLRNLWKINPETLSWKKVQLKGSGSFSMNKSGCCVVGDRVVIFGYDKGVYMAVCIFDFSPSLKTLCKLAVRRYGLEQSELPHDLREELAAGRRRRRKRRRTTAKSPAFCHEDLPPVDST